MVFGNGSSVTYNQEGDPQEIKFVGGGVIKLKSRSDYENPYFQPGSILYSSNNKPFIFIGLDENNEGWVRDPEGINGPRLVRLHEYSIIDFKESRKRPLPELGSVNQTPAKVAKLFPKTVQFQADTCDVFFEVDGERWGGHRFVLRSVSHYFRKLLDENKGKETIVLSDCTKAEFNTLLQFLYSGHLEVNPENVLLVARIAHRYGIRELESKCQDFLKKFLTPKTIPGFFIQLSEEDQSLKLSVRYIFFEHMKHIVKEFPEEIGQFTEEHISFLFENYGDLFKKQKQSLAFVFAWAFQQNSFYSLEILCKIYSLVPEEYSTFLNYAQLFSWQIHMHPDKQDSLEEFIQNSDNINLKILYATALHHYLRQDKKAKIQVEQILQLGCQSTFVLLLYVKILLRLNLKHEADPKIKELKDHHFKNFSNLELGVQILVRHFDFDRALKELQEIMKVHPNDTCILNGYAKLLYKNGEKENARNIWQSVLKKNPENVPALIGYGYLTAPKENIERLSYLERILVIEPGNITVMKFYVLTLRKIANSLSLKPTIQENDYRKVESYYEKAIKIQPQNILFLREYAWFLATCRLSQGKAGPYLEKAKTYYEKILDVDVYNAKALGEYAWTLQQLGEPERAATFFEKAIDLEPGNREILDWYKQTVKILENKEPAVLSEYAQTLNELGQFDKAEAYFKQAIEMDSENADVLGEYAEFLSNSHELEAAETYFKKAIDFDSNNVWNLIKYALTLQKLGKFEEAQNQFKEVLRIEPGNLDALVLGADNLVKLGKKEEAKTYFEKAIDVEPGNKSALIRYAKALYRFGEFEEADIQFKKALEIQPEYVITYPLNLMSLGNFQAAIDVFKQMLANPSLSDFRKNFIKEKYEHALKSLTAVKT